MLTLLNTRPQHQASALTQAITASGYQVIDCPAIAIEACVLPAQSFTQLAEFDHLIFISQNAVQQFAAQWQQHFQAPLSLSAFAKHAQCYAIGQATYDALAAIECPLAALHSLGDTCDYTSESLLHHPNLQALQNQRCLIIKGQGGREALQAGLQAKGAQVEAWSVYQRIAPPFCEQAWQQFLNAPHPVSLATSLQAWQHLLLGVQNLDSKAKKGTKTCHTPQGGIKAWWFLQDIIVFSERIKAVLKQHHWQGRIVVVETQSNLGIVSALEKIALTPPASHS